MGITIGDINIPFVSGFSVDKADKPIEVIKHLGNIPPHVAEFQADVLKATISGTLFQASGDVRDVDQYAEDLDTLVDRFGVYNYINDYQSRSGWLILSTGDSDKSADSVLIRKYSLAGRFMPKNKYQTRMHTAPAILTNDFSLTLGAGGCDNYVPLPIGATYSGGDGSTITRAGKDGTTTLVKATTNNDIKWDLDTDEVDVGECKVWDDMNEVLESDWVRVFNPDHVFTGKIVVENGLFRLILTPLTSNDTDVAKMYYYDSTLAAWTWVSDFGYRSGNITQWDFTIIYASITYTPNNFKPMFSKISPDEIILICKFDGTQIGGTWMPNFDMKITINRNMYYAEVIFSSDLNITNFQPEIRNGAVQNLYYGASENDHRNSIFPDSANPFDGTNDNWIINYSDTSPDAIIFMASNKNIEYRYETYICTNCLNNISKDDILIIGLIPFDISYLFKECEDMTQGAGVAYYTGVDASPKTGNTGSILDAQNENVYYEFTGGTDLPLGTYKLFMRAKDSAQVADDISCLVRNTTDSTDVMAETTKTLTGAWAYYSFDVTIASDDDTDTIRVTLNKETATANTIDLDYVLWVPITLDSGNGPQDIAHQAMVDQNLTRELITR
jgi:hypothetical protein